MKAKLISTRKDDLMNINHDILLTMDDAEYKMLVSICEDDNMSLELGIACALVTYKRIHQDINRGE